MSKPQSKTELVRLAWIAALRRQGHRQCHGEWWGLHGNVCAMALLVEVAGLKADIWINEEKVGRSAGLSQCQSNRVVGMNDGAEGLCRRHTFAEIADMVESWFLSSTGTEG